MRKTFLLVIWLSLIMLGCMKETVIERTYRDGIAGHFYLQISPDTPRGIIKTGQNVELMRINISHDFNTEKTLSSASFEIRNLNHTFIPETTKTAKDENRSNYWTEKTLFSSCHLETSQGDRNEWSWLNHPRDETKVRKECLEEGFEETVINYILNSCSEYKGYYSPCRLDFTSGEIKTGGIKYMQKATLPPNEATQVRLVCNIKKMTSSPTNVQIYFSSNVSYEEELKSSPLTIIK